MKKIALLLLVVSVLFASGCVNLPSVDYANVGLLGLGEPKYTVPEEISVDVEAHPSTVRSGREMKAFFDVTNTGNTTLKDVRLEDIDNCVFDPEDDDLENIGEDMRSGDKRTVTWEFNAPTDIDMKKSCDMRYRVSYDSTAKAVFNIRALKEEEYILRERAGDLDKLSDVRYEKTKTPVEIMANVSEQQPMMGGDDFLVHFYLENNGEGFVEDRTIGKEDIVMSYPENMLTLMGCQGRLIEESDSDEIEEKKKEFSLGCRAKATCSDGNCQESKCKTNCSDAYCPDIDNAYKTEGSENCKTSEIENSCRCKKAEENVYLCGGGKCSAEGTCHYKCEDEYYWNGEECVQSVLSFRGTDFNNGRTAKTSCKFSIDKDIDTSETGTFNMYVNYTYLKDGEFSAELSP